MTITKIVYLADGVEETEWEGRQITGEIGIAGGMIVIVTVIVETAREIETGPSCWVLLFPDLVPLLWHENRDFR
jgi:hypothetical protein